MHVEADTKLANVDYIIFKLIFLAFLFKLIKMSQLMFL